MSADVPQRSILERAAERLEQLQRAGVELPARGAAAAQPSAELPTQAPNLFTGIGGAEMRPGTEGPPFPARPPLQQSQFPDLPPQQTVHIDIDRLTLAGYLAPRADRTALAEEFRNLKRPLLAKARSDSGAIAHGNLIMVTSALAGEGKTFAAINLAISMASEFDASVILVDADTARPSLLTRLGVTASTGLTDLLQDPSIALRDVLLGTNIEGLTLLPSGTRYPSSTEMLASEAMQRLTARLAGNDSNRIILFDSPPLLATSEARVLASLMGQIVVMVEAQKTSEAAVREMLATLESCPEVTLVLNKARKGRSEGRYGGYGY